MPDRAWLLTQLRRLLLSRLKLPRLASAALLRLPLPQSAVRHLAAALMRLPALERYELSMDALRNVRTAGDLLAAVVLNLSLQQAAPRPVAKKTAGKKPPAARAVKRLAKKPKKKAKKKKSSDGEGRPASAHSTKSRRKPARPRRERAPRRMFDTLTGDSDHPTAAFMEALRTAGPPQMPERTARFANVVLTNGRGTVLDRSRSLEPAQTVRLRLDIGPLSAESQVENPEEFPDRILPVDIWLDVLVSSTDFVVASHDGKARGTVAQSRLFLPGDGGPATNPDGGRHLVFELTAPDRPRGDAPARARIGYYYRNILVQSQCLIAHVGGDGGFKVVTDYTQSADLTGLDAIPDRPRLSVFTNANDDGGHQIILRHPDVAQTGTESAVTVAVEGKEIDPTVTDLRKALTSLAPETSKVSRDALAALLRKIAPLGALLYQQLPGQKAFGFFLDVYDNPEKYVIQVARPDTSSFVLPWDLIYEIPLTSGVEPALCEMVATWDGKRDLFDGMPRQCPHGPHLRDVLCPFGFWGFRYTVEQLSRTDAIAKEIVAAPDSRWVVGETQIGIDLKALDAHIAKLRALLAGALPKATLSEGRSRQTLEDLLGSNLPFVYFFCHGNKRNIADPNLWLAVGKDEPITAGDVVGWPRIWYGKLKKLFWDEVRPLIFVNACQSLAIESTTLVSYLDAFLGSGNASGVIGTEIKVSQPLAMDVGQRFFESWVRGETVEAALRAIRMDYLRQGNMFGLVYTPYCWSELRIRTS
ncbi:MAG: CHAT domain-containing protein [Rhizomicrobium sp.]